MAGRWNLLILALHLSFVMVLSKFECPQGYKVVGKKNCYDFDECPVDEDYPDEVGPCGENAVCHNTIGSFYCTCSDGSRSSTGIMNFTAGTSATCEDINECLETENICGPNAKCFNIILDYSCICDDGFISTTGVENFHHGDNVACGDIDECEKKNVCSENAACFNTPGSYHCVCNDGFVLKSGKSNFTGNQEQCEGGGKGTPDTKIVCGRVGERRR